MMGHWQGTSSNVLRIVGSQLASCQQGATRIIHLNGPVICYARNLVRARIPYS